ncbi:DUF5776 domain-containing protein [Apilactobacillus micheneri]|uniref:DUF5776 domain-containing protein n=1 Tax=Apilactobacillus micheneri TaxID=1899430 RepID=UPI00112BBC5B|nr:DUF5776 domain-containing protein [Apilactobacillus micheneri]TPR51073.1 hypothetical protein DY126_05905 [Apilactobacillus micheneri]
MTIDKRISALGLGESKVAAEVTNDDNISGFNDALNNSSMTKPTSEKSQDYDTGFNLGLQYRQAIYDGSKNVSNSQSSVDNSQRYYDAANQGYNDAKDSYNTETQNDGTDGHYETYEDYTSQQGNSSKTQQDYSTDRTNALNSKSNYSIRNSGDIDIKSTDDMTHNKTYNDEYLSAAYKYGANYFLSNQATEDAKSGKWQGTNNQVNKDYYDSGKSSSTYDTGHKNAYYQSYEGAKAAISKQFDTQNNYTQLSENSNTNNLYYDNSYNSVVSDSQNGTAYVSNGQQLNDVLAGSPTGSTASANNPVGNNIHTVRLVNDANIWDAFQNDRDKSNMNPSNNGNLVIDGQNHIADFAGSSYYFTNKNASNSVTIKNFQTVYGTNYYGPVASNSGQIHYSNINYMGPQLLESNTNDVYIDGNVSAYQNFNNSKGYYYNTPFKNQPSLQGTGGGNQETIVANSLTISQDAHYFGDRSQNNSANNLTINSGNLTLGKNSSIDLIARSNYYGINLPSGSINIDKNASLNVLPGVENGVNYLGTAIKSNGDIYIDGGNLNVNITGNTTDNNPVNTSGNITLNNGSINISTTNMTNSSSGLLYNTGNINVLNNSIIKIDAHDSTNTGAINLIKGDISLNNPKSLDLYTNTNGTITSGTINANTVAVKDNSDANTNIYYKYNVDSSGNVTAVNSAGTSDGTPTTINGTKHLVMTQVPSAYVVGPVTTKYSNGTITISGNIQTTGVDGINLSNNNVYLKYDANNGGNPNKNNPGVQSGYGDKTEYYDNYNSPGNQTHSFTETISGLTSKPDNVKLDIKYGIQGIEVKSSDPNDDGVYVTTTTSSQNYDKADGNQGGLKSNLTQLSTTDNNVINDAINAGISDSQNSGKPGYISQKDLLKYQQNNNDYPSYYDAASNGYESYIKKPNNDENAYQSADGYTDAKNNHADDAFEKGYKQAQQDNKDANNNAISDFNDGKPLNPNNATYSNVDTYNNAYNDYQKGYQEGLSGNKPASMTPNETAGYNSARNISAGNVNPGANDLSQGYKDAINDFYNNGKNKSTDINNYIKDNNKPGYKETIKGLIDGKTNPNTDSQTTENKPLYEIARAQSVGAKNGINDAKTNSPTNTKAPNGVNVQAYNTAHDAAKSGYNDGNGKNDYDDKQSDNPVYTNSFAQGSQQRGADDYLNGNYDSNKGDGSKDGNYSKGAKDAKDGLNDAQNSGLNNPDDPNQQSKISQDLNGKSDAYANAFEQGVYANKGYQEATSNNGSSVPTLSEDKSNQAEVDAYWGAQTGANTGKSYSDTPANSAPNTNSQFYKSAEQRAQQDIANGTQDYINDKSQGKTGDQLKPSEANKNDPLYTQGYNNQKAYDDGFNGKTGDGIDTTSKSYQDGKSAAASNSDFNKVKDGKSNSTIDGNYENNGALQGFNDAKSGSQFNPSNGMKDKSGNILTGDDATKYQGAYAKAYSEATDQMNKGAQQYSSDKNNNQDTSVKTPNANDNQDTQSFDQGYNNQKAYDAGFNNPDATTVPQEYSQQSVSYQAGQNAAKKQANNSNNSPMSGAGKDATAAKPDEATTNRPKDNTNNAQDAYDGAKAGYVDGSNGNSANSNVGKSSDYQQAYNKAYGDMQKSRQDGTNDFFGKVNGNSLNDPNAIKTAASSAKDGKDINSKAHNNAFAEQQGYAAGLAGQNDNPYNDSGNGSNKDAYKNANQAASQAKAGYQEAQNSSDPTKTSADQVNNPKLDNDSAKDAYQAASQAFADAKANKPSDNSGKDANYKNAYNMAYNQNRAAMSEGENDALGKDGGNTNIPSGQYPSDITTPSAKALYDNAKGNASQGYADAMKPSNANNANAPEGSSKEYTDGYNQAKSISAGANAAIAGAKQAPTASGNQNQDQVNAGFNAAQQAIKNGLADAQSGKNKPNNGKFDENQIFSGAKDVPSTARQAYINAYEGAYNGYNNGLNGGSQKPSSDKDAKYGNDTTYSAAYDNAFKQGQNDIPAPTPTPAPNNNNNKPNNDKDDQEAGTKAGQKAFAGGTPLNINYVNFAGKSQAYKDAFTKGYNDSQAGFDAGLNGGNNNNSDNPSFKAGYQSAQAYKQGVKDATRGKKPAKNSSDAYKVGYEAYKEGISGKKANKETLDKLAPAYRKAYEKNYQAARKAYVAVAGKASKAARKNAVGTKRIPRSLKHESPAYQAAYMEAFNRYVKDNLPRYVYNLKKVYSHNAPALTHSTRVNKYSKTPRYDRHVFRVLGYKITSSGHVVYRVKGLGWISASDKSVDNVYYRRHDTKKPIQKVRVIKPQGTYIYSSKTFNKKTAVKKMKKGSTVKVERIETVGGITRFYIGNGQYISSNKTIVEHVR